MESYPPLDPPLVGVFVFVGVCVLLLPFLSLTLLFPISISLRPPSLPSLSFSGFVCFLFLLLLLLSLTSFFCRADVAVVSSSLFVLPLAMSTLLRASPPSSLLHEHFILHYVVRSSSLSSAISPHSLRTISSSSHLSFTNPMPSLSNIRHPRILPISPLFSSPRISCHHKCSSSVGAFGLGGFRSLQSTNSVGQGIQRRAVERDSGDHNAKHMRDVASFDDVDNQISQELEKDAARSELRNAEVRPQTRKSANGILSYKIVSSGSSSDEEDFVERSRNRQRFTSSAVNVENHSTDRNRKVKVNADKKKRSLDVTAIRNVDTHTAPENGEEEIKVFEKWASMKVKEEGSSVEPVIVEMRASLLQRLAGDSQPLTVDGISELQTEFPNARSQSLDLPAEKDPLAFVDPAKRPIVIKRSSKVPEDWDGPGGTVVLIDKPLGDVTFVLIRRKSEWRA